MPPALPGCRPPPRGAQRRPRRRARQWMARDDSKADPDSRRASNTAMDEIDANAPRAPHSPPGADREDTRVRRRDDAATEQLLAQPRELHAQPLPAWRSARTTTAGCTGDRGPVGALRSGGRLRAHGLCS